MEALEFATSAKHASQTALIIAAFATSTFLFLSKTKIQPFCKIGAF